MRCRQPKFQQIFFRLAAFALFCGKVHAASFDESFAVVNIDTQTEAKIGGFPNRAVLAQLIDRIATGKPKSIVLKFFLDTPGSEPDSILLAQSMKKTRVILQASLDKDPPTSKELDERFYFKERIAPLKPVLAGEEGWLPQKRFSDQAPKVCFANVVRVEQVPMFAMFQRRPVESLYACALAEAFGDGKTVLQGHRALFGKQTLAFDDAGEARIGLADLTLPQSVSALRLLDANFDAGAFSGKVVILAYTGSRTPTVSVRGAAIGLHQVFLAQLREIVALVR
jgi:hypothetical protein